MHGVYNWTHKRLFVHDLTQDNCENWNYDGLKRLTCYEIALIHEERQFSNMRVSKWLQTQYYFEYPNFNVITRTIE